MDAVQTVAVESSREIDVKKYAKVEKLPGGSIEDCRSVSALKRVHVAEIFKLVSVCIGHQIRGFGEKCPAFDFTTAWLCLCPAEQEPEVLR